MVDLTKKLKVEGFHITFETNGTIYEPVEADLMVVSPKLKSSIPIEFGEEMVALHMRNRLNYDAMERLLDDFDCVFKFVVDKPEDFDEIFEDFIGPLDLPHKIVYIMPQGIDRDEIRKRARWIVETCQQHNFRYSPRVQIDIFGNKPGT